MRFIRKFFKRRHVQDETNNSIENHDSYYDFTKKEKEIISFVESFTMTSPERLVSLIRSIEYLNKCNIRGAVVECGVWRGGSIMAALLSLQVLNDSSRKIYLYDTFEGMNKPTEKDFDFQGNKAKELLLSKDKTHESHIWGYCSLDEVKANISSTKYPIDNIYFINGQVEKTLIESDIPETIALLRLDTDWYESTKIELERLFPKLVKGGVLIIDDYGYWNGSKRAVDEYIKVNKLQLFLSRIDCTGRVAIKQ